MNYKEAQKYADEIDKGLLCTDKAFDNAVQIIDEDGTVLFFRNASLYRCKKDMKWLILFSGHQGTQVFSEEDLLGYHQYLQIRSLEII
jgi:hypothetical protein